MHRPSRVFNPCICAEYSHGQDRLGRKRRRPEARQSRAATPLSPLSPSVRRESPVIWTPAADRDLKGERTRTRFFSVCVIPSTHCGEVPRPETGNSGCRFAEVGKRPGIKASRFARLIPLTHPRVRLLVIRPQLSEYCCD